MSLLEGGYDVSLIVADDNGDENSKGVKIYDVGKVSGGRFNRIKDTPKKVLKKALELNCDLYHFHDPELISVGLKLLKKGKKVIYDTHEDIPKQTLAKDYIPYIFRKALSVLIKIYEDRAAKKFSFIITATPSIRDRFIQLNQNTVDINNFPIIDEYNLPIIQSDKKNEIAYIGSISEIRGIIPLINSLENTDVRLNLAGVMDNDELMHKLEKLNAWSRVNYYGLVKRNEVAEILSRSKIGMVTFLPVPNHIEAQPNKMFEYMSAEIPLIASDFKLWKEIIEGYNCGICVDPENTNEISKAINEIITDDKLAAKMGKNGRNAVINKYNWEVEKNKFIEIYSTLTK
jgi:glycosyltransferase involved in cell wall biosynthesis